jgi:hypothetical protein
MPLEVFTEYVPVVLVSLTFVMVATRAAHRRTAAAWQITAAGRNEAHR